MAAAGLWTRRLLFSSFTRLKPLHASRHTLLDAAVDTAGGDVLAAVLAKLKPRGAVAACGNAAGASFETTVFPFILRGARLLGVDSVNSPPEERDEVWTRLDRDLDRGKLAATVTTVPLTDVPALAEDILAGKVRGRVVVDVTA